MVDERPNPNDASLDDIVAEFAAELELDGDVDPDEFLRKYPEASSELREAILEVIDLRSALGHWQDQGDTFASAVTADHGRDQNAWAGFLEQLERRRGDDSRYEIRGRIASGGFGDVLRVRDLDLRQTLAMKVLRNRAEPDKPLHVKDVDPRVLGWFLQEAQITAQLNHPAIVPVHELGLTAQGEVYFTMKYVKGITLREALKKVQDSAEEWTVTRALGVILKACDALAHAHQKGVIHRDVKPANIMVGGPGEVYVMDWGLARFMHEVDAFERPIEGLFESSIIATEREDLARESPQSPLLTSGVVPGTPMYMSPEQAAGRWGELGPHSDVFAMGGILYELLAGQAPYVNPGESLPPLAIIARVADGPPKPIRHWKSDVPAELEAICEKAMSHTIEGRYPTMVELADDLRSFLEGRVVKAYAAGPLAEIKKWALRNRGVASASLLGLLLFVVVVAVFSSKLNAVEYEALLLKTTIDNAPAGILVFDDQADCLYANEHISQLLNISRAALLEQNALELASWKASGLDNAFRQAMETNTVVAKVFHGYTSQGDRTAFRAQLVPLKDSGSRRLLFLCHSLSEYAAAQAQLVQKAPVVVIDLETSTVISATYDAIELLGRDDLVGLGADLIIPAVSSQIAVVLDRAGNEIVASHADIEIDGRKRRILVLLTEKQTDEKPR